MMGTEEESKNEQPSGLRAASRVAEASCRAAAALAAALRARHVYHTPTTRTKQQQQQQPRRRTSGHYGHRVLVPPLGFSVRGRHLRRRR